MTELSKQDTEVLNCWAKKEAKSYWADGFDQFKAIKDWKTLTDYFPAQNRWKEIEEITVLSRQAAEKRKHNVCQFCKNEKEEGTICLSCFNEKRKEAIEAETKRCLKEIEKELKDEKTYKYPSNIEEFALRLKKRY